MGKRERLKRQRGDFMKTRVVCVTVLLLGLFCFAPAAPGRAGSAPLTFGTLPVIQALPLFVAEEAGLFKAEGLEVSLVPFRTAMDKDVAMTTGKIEGYFGDLFTPIVLKANGVDVRLAARNFSTGAGQRMFGVLTGPKSEIQNLAGLAGVPVAVSSHSIIEYVTDTLLRSGGVPADQIRFLESKNIPVRFQMLMTGQVQAATLPEPLVTMAENQGCRVLADDRDTELSSTVLIFAARTIAEREADIRKFLAAVDKAAALINSDPEKYRPVMLRHCNVPKPLEATYKIPAFPKLAAPSRERTEAAVLWLSERGVLKTTPAYTELVDDRFFK